ncbi:MAG: 5'-methylthioadenosine/adenosylhomocysteine nucleosidase [Cytophagaceae bacterium]|nr:5'-methylthioadenosine/adenosylhomocysteine nucleosidase [Cytophagaceae bacterium]
MSVRILFIILFLSLKIAAQKIAIIGAMPEEIELLKENMQKMKVKTHHDLTFYEGKIEGQKVVVMKGGIGKVNAAYSTALLLEKYPIEKIIFTGVAGGLHPDAQPGDIVIADSIFHHDYVRYLPDNKVVSWPTRNIIEGKPNPFAFACDTILTKKAITEAAFVKFQPIEGHMPQIFKGKIATGDAFVSSHEKAAELYQKHHALATEMEGAAVAQIAYQRGVRFLIIRSCSDNANNNASVDFRTFVKPAAENAIRLVLRILAE